MLCKLKACRKCYGDLVLDGDEWRCWQCGLYYYPKPPVTESPPAIDHINGAVLTLGRTTNGRLHRRSRAARDINAVIAAKDRSEDRWWNRNKDVIRYLDEGRTVRDISLLIGRGQRQIRVIRERLNDIRACGQELSTVS